MYRKEGTTDRHSVTVSNTAHHITSHCIVFHTNFFLNDTTSYGVKISKLQIYVCFYLSLGNVKEYRLLF